MSHYTCSAIPNLQFFPDAIEQAHGRPISAASSGYVAGLLPRSAIDCIPLNPCSRVTELTFSVSQNYRKVRDAQSFE